MKTTTRILLALVTLLLLGGCNIADVVSLSPPDWIQGTWADEFDINTYEFRSSTVIFTVSSMPIDFTVAYAQSSMGDSSTSTTYLITVVDTGVSASYYFEDIDAASLNYSITNNGVTVGPIVLYKK